MCAALDGYGRDCIRQAPVSDLAMENGSSSTVNLPLPTGIDSEH
jgi:hypothetical protein